MHSPTSRFRTLPNPFHSKEDQGSQNHGLRYGFIFLFTFSLAILLGSQVSLGKVRGSARPSIQIWVHYRGAFAEEIERLITLPLENALGELAGLRELYSLSEREKCRLHLVFTENTCMDDAYLEVREVVDRVYQSFPPAVQRPVLTQSNPQDHPVFIAAFPLTLGLTEEELKQRFEQVEGVGEVEMGGRSKEEIVLQWLPEPGIAKGISAWHLARTVQSWNVRGGFTAEESYPSRFIVPKDFPQEFSDLSLSTSLRLSDACYIQTRLVRSDSLARVKGEELLVVYVRPTGDAKLFSLSATLQKVAKEIPGSKVLYDSGHSLKTSFYELSICLLSGTILLTLLTFLCINRLIPSLLLGMSIPFSLTVSLSGLYLFQHTLNLSSMSNEGS
ncbi:MAG: efflux RND transporter permease subunit, partial [Spirochaetales bacterium]